jgi:hypothetical protein
VEHSLSLGPRARRETKYTFETFSGEIFSGAAFSGAAALAAAFLRGERVYVIVTPLVLQRQLLFLIRKRSNYSRKR